MHICARHPMCGVDRLFGSARLLKRLVRGLIRRAHVTHTVACTEIWPAHAPSISTYLMSFFGCWTPPFPPSPGSCPVSLSRWKMVDVVIEGCRGGRSCSPKAWHSSEAPPIPVYLFPTITNFWTILSFDPSRRSLFPINFRPFLSFIHILIPPCVNLRIPFSFFYSVTIVIALATPRPIPVWFLSPVQFCLALNLVNLAWSPSLYSIVSYRMSVAL